MARIFCIGRNYAQHAKELGNAVPDAPVVFMKPPESLVPPGGTVRFPRHGRELHHEVELVFRVGREARDVSPAEGAACLDAVTVGVDLTLRDVQAELKKKGLPWEAAKAFEQSALVGDFVPVEAVGDLSALSFWCDVNGTRRQQGSSADMLFGPGALVAHLSRIWTLRPGDLIYTGTPEGVGPLAPGDTLAAGCEHVGLFSWQIRA
jgi:2-keto-4-pentenoate hydratase/2-oxohepta-3-ene-1,7-dioic acid hydratase in catechol pathway